jgi:hypothetical protein
MSGWRVLLVFETEFFLTISSLPQQQDIAHHFTHDAQCHEDKQ